ncbi:hypothetical protein [Streptomyces sp. NPDC004008]
MSEIEHWIWAGTAATHSSGQTPSVCPASSTWSSAMVLDAIRSPALSAYTHLDTEPMVSRRSVALAEAFGKRANLCARSTP